MKPAIPKQHPAQRRDLHLNLRLAHMQLLSHYHRLHQLSHQSVHHRYHLRHMILRSGELIEVLQTVKSAQLPQSPKADSTDFKRARSGLALTRSNQPRSWFDSVSFPASTPPQSLVHPFLLHHWSLPLCSTQNSFQYRPRQ